MSKNVRKALLALLVILVLLFVVLGIIMAPLPPTEPLPNPNGYDDFVRAGKMIAGPLDDAAKLALDELRALIQTNAEPLRLARLGLTRRCAVPTDANIANFANNTSEMIALKRLAVLLSSEGRLKELDNQLGDAARCYVETIHLGSAMSHGGFLINRLVGIACEAIGAIRLTKLVPNLSCEQSRPLISELQEMDTNTVSWEEVARNEKRFARAAMQRSNPLELISGLAQLAWSRVQGRSMIQKNKVKHDSAAAHLRLIEVELALRCYRGEQGSVPASLDQLVPKYLSRVLLDPFSDHPLVYQAQGTNWLLYSLGPDRVDDGGKPFVRTSSGTITGEGSGTPVASGDLRYDLSW
jgi:hypothetical protein